MQVKDIKPGVLSKIFLYSNADPDKAEDEKTKRLILVSKSLEDCLLNYSNYKPNKKNKEGRKLMKGNEKSFRALIKGILEFK